MDCYGEFKTKLRFWRFWCDSIAFKVHSVFTGLIKKSAESDLGVFETHQQRDTNLKQQ